MNNNLTVSVLIPALNEEKTLPFLIKALEMQTIKPLEIIVIDSASTDNTLGIAKALGVIALHEDKRGTNNALETGRAQAKGDLIARIDADCIPNPDWIEEASSYFKNPKVVTVGGPYDYYDGDKAFRNVSLYFQKYVYTSMNLFLRFFRLGGVLVGGNSMMRASTLEQIGGFDRNIKFYGDDTDLAKRMSKKGKVVFDGNLLMKSSARRFHTIGFFNTLWEYLRGFAKATIKH